MPKILQKNNNVLYSVTFFKGDSYDLIHWDEPMEPDQVNKVLSQARRDDWSEDNINDLEDGFGISDAYRDDPVDAGSIYSLIADTLGGEDKASKFLEKAGIDGIEYESAIIRDIDASSQYKNYVIFNTNNITIEKKINI